MKLNNTKIITVLLYLNSFWFNKNNSYYNYSNIMKKFYNNDNILNKMYMTNNIVESIHSRINYNLPKHKYNKQNFIKCIENIIYNDMIKDNDIIRHDYKTKGLLLIIEKENINKEPKWINLETFQNYFDRIKKII